MMNNYLYFENKLIDKNIEHNLEQYRCDDNRFRYIYKTTNLINGEYYKGQHTTKKEYITIIDHYYGSGSIFKKSLSKYGRQNFRVDIIEFAKTKYELDILEETFITMDDINNPSCLNLKTGGESGKGFSNPDTFVKVYMFSLSGEFQQSFDSATDAIAYLSNETNEQCVKSAIFRCMNNVRRTYKNHLWSYTSDPPKTKSWKRPVYVFDMKKQYVATFISCMEAAKWLKTITKKDIQLPSISSSISACCNMTMKSYMNYHFSYVERLDPHVDNKSLLGFSRRGKPVDMLDKNTGEIIMTFDSIAKATKYLNKPNSSGTIYGAINHKCNRLTAFGYRWQYSISK